MFFYFFMLYMFRESLSPNFKSVTTPGLYVLTICKHNVNIMYIFLVRAFYIIICVVLVLPCMYVLV
jgi:hypothetical protein